jgi:hypothetical protein
MDTQVNRRAFVGTIAAGLPLLGGVAVGAVQRGGAATRVGADAVEAELLRQIRENVKSMQGPRRGESARGLAATLRLAAADFRQKGVDAQVKTLLRASLRREGEEAFLLKEIDGAILAAELKELGIARLPVVLPDYAARRQAVRQILAEGATPGILAAADALERVSKDLDNYPIVPVSMRQCPDLKLQIALVEVMMIAACLANVILCAVFSGIYAGLIIGLAIYGC